MNMKYLVRGICMVPTEAEMEVEADSPEQALALAQDRFKVDPSSLLVPRGADEGAAYDWFAEALPIS